jgi:8-oxo-dGTP pyrophosphatase MutT (NUDIX family)
MDEDEEPEEAVKREVKEETGLDVDVHHLVDVFTYTWADRTDNTVRILFHCEADEPRGEPMDYLQDLDWVMPDGLEQKLGENEIDVVENRPNVEQFLEKIRAIPSDPRK